MACTGLPLLAAAALKPHPDRERLLREESARLLESRYEAAFAQAQVAQVRGDLQAERVSLEEALRNKPRDPQAVAALDQVNSQIAAIAAWNDRIASIVSALEHDDWRGAEQRFSGLPLPPQSVQPLAHVELIPILRLCSEGRLVEARKAATPLVIAGREKAAASAICRFVNAQMRATSLPAGVGITFGAYIAVLLGSLYLGLSRYWLKAEQ
jgi:hypothetical protein